MMQVKTYTYAQHSIEYECFYSSRRRSRIALHVLPHGVVHIEAPLRTSQRIIEQVINKRLTWILAKKKLYAHKFGVIKPLEYKEGELHYFMGKRYPLKFIQAGPQRVRLWRGTVEVQSRIHEAQQVRNLLNAWYQKQARAFFLRKLPVFVEQCTWVVQVPLWTQRRMQTRWGSCNSLGKLTLNTNLILAPKQCMEYVLWHELCHIQELNHSSRFYALLAEVLPKWKILEKQLDALAPVLLYMPEKT